MKLIPSKSAIKHSRFFFSIFLMPVYFFALSQAENIQLSDAILVFVSWHFFIYPASNCYNSYFDQDEGSIALLKNPPPVDKSLYSFSLLLDAAGVIIAAFVNLEFVVAVIIYGCLSKLYSHTSVRLKRYPFISFLIVFIFQGAFIYWSSYAAMTGQYLSEIWSGNMLLAGLVCSCLVGASYPLTQIYQHAEDKKRGDTTLSMLLGIRGTILFSAVLFALSMILMFLYWYRNNQIQNFWIFLVFVLPAMAIFINWALKLKRDKSEANFKNMNRMTFVSGLAMLGYFILLSILNRLIY